MVRAGAGGRAWSRMARLPLQGGLPPVDAVAGAVVEIACDESGFSGTNLLDPATPVITHASVDLGVDEAVGADRGAAVRVPVLAERVQVRAVPPQPDSG